MNIETVMAICAEALKKAGYIISDYSEADQNFIVSDGDDFISIDIDKVI